MWLSRWEYWNGLPFPSPGDLPDPEIELRSPVLQADSSPTELLGKPKFHYSHIKYTQARFKVNVWWQTLCASKELDITHWGLWESAKRFFNINTSMWTIPEEKTLMLFSQNDAWEPILNSSAFRKKRVYKVRTGSPHPPPSPQFQSNNPFANNWGWFMSLSSLFQIFLNAKQTGKF